jgi:hypothetical protein
MPIRPSCTLRVRLRNGLTAGVTKSKQHLFSTVWLLATQAAESFLQLLVTIVPSLPSALHPIHERRELNELESGVHEAMIHKIGEGR